VEIAVVIPTFNRPVRLRQALASVASQTRRADEVHVVVDGGPPDEGLEQEFGESFSFFVHRLPENRGQAAARNHALSRTEAHAIAFLDDDDLYLERHLERLERALREDPSLVLVYDDCEIQRLGTHFDDSATSPPTRCIAHGYDPGLMRRYDYIPPACWLVRADSMGRAGGFDGSFRCYEDWDLLLRLEAWGGIRRTPGPGALIRLAAEEIHSGEAVLDGRQGNQSLRFDADRLDALNRFQAKHGLEGIEPMTFWDVAEAIRSGERQRPHAEPPG
jgi:glycosyltransferase involved in cell wall biosynthesis